MGFLKSYKNVIILIFIITSIVFSTNIVEFISASVKKVEKMFSASKPDYSNLSNQEYKIKSSAPAQKKSDSSSESSPKNEGARSMFKAPKKEELSPEELDKQIMENKDSQSDKDRRRELFERSKRQFNDSVKQNKMADETFDMDMKKEFEDF